jgi:hypothetical protein
MKRTLMIVIGIILIFGISLVYAAVSTPGSETDPVVTKSYVDSRVTYIPVRLDAGQKLIGDEGTEIILRSGEATAIDNGLNGVSDITGGLDLLTGNKVTINHLLLIPRKDGRGISVSTEAWVMIRGNYTIQ